ncbi:alpha/beta-hydrolase [Coniochaeta ligniaria NRRL 30616]|uniref:Carboxylic ester hydrolase n=1 Tax=Coniochaeta ligniaria NRRL 30616 TaxID=1408157 RepID=A0A1J7JIQ7_9PEZI|nr:alpha/beta-hydrolase [Coniochaeta ligniaria NRRL 30616]
MTPLRTYLALCLLPPSLGAYQTTSLPADLTVRTTTGIYTALLDPSLPNVRQFRNIPYALPPTGPRRWLPPVAVPPSTTHHYAYTFPPSCPQYLPAPLSVWNTNISDFSIDVAGQSHFAGTLAQTTAEDCLSLAIWAPRSNLNLSSEGNPLLPVILFLPGGSFQRGGVSVPYQIPGGWVQRSARHIAVTANYRVNIMGFPSFARGLEDQNPGLLDARMALEWVYANIAAFGGDRDRITLWGQSAGAVVADMLAYAWWEEPLVAGLFLQSGSANVPGGTGASKEPGESNFTFVARSLGCDFPDDGEAEMGCMRGVPVARIVNFVGGYGDNGTTPALGFKTVDDGRTGFGNYTLRALEEGRVARVPALISTTANEEASLWKYPVKDVAAGPNMTAVDAATVEVFVCLAANATDVRAALGVTTYRYQYAGNFSNLTPLPWLGAYHASDIPLLMGSYERGGPATGFERSVAETMQDYLLAFMEDPEDGLRRKGWEPHVERVSVGGNMVRFAVGDTVADNASASEVDFACVSGAPYNRSP